MGAKSRGRITMGRKSSATLYFAEQGFNVCMISVNEIQSLPPPLHGVLTPGADVFRLIRFLYLPKRQDLLQHLYSIHCHARVPSVIIIDSLQKYFIPTKNDTSKELGQVDIDIQQAALICASLLDAGAVCAERLKKKVHILLSIKKSSLSENNLNTLLNTFFNDFKWFLEMKLDDETETDELVLFSHDKKHIFTFSKAGEAGLCLKEIFDSSV